MQSLQLKHFKPTHYALFKLELCPLHNVPVRRQLVAIFPDSLPDQLYMNDEYEVVECFDESHLFNCDGISNLKIVNNDAGYYVWKNDCESFYSIINNTFEY